MRSRAALPLLPLSALGRIPKKMAANHARLSHRTRTKSFETSRIVADSMTAYFPRRRSSLLRRAIQTLSSRADWLELECYYLPA
jgi:hypothetical protein